MKLSATELERAVTEILIEEEDLQRRIADLGTEISADYEGRDLLELFLQAVTDANSAGLPVLLGLMDSFHQSSPWGEREWRVLDGRAVQDLWIVDPTKAGQEREVYTTVYYFDGYQATIKRFNMTEPS